MKCGVIGGFLIGIIGVLLPPTMFWGEFEINTLANPLRPLAHIWPQVIPPFCIITLGCSDCQIIPECVPMYLNTFVEDVTVQL